MTKTEAKPAIAAVNILNNIKSKVNIDPPRVPPVAGDSEMAPQGVVIAQNGLGNCSPLLASGPRAARQENLTASPPDGAVSSPSHITRRPRTKVPTGQPVTVLPS
jgi:hypothetical protein